MKLEGKSNHVQVMSWDDFSYLVSRYSGGKASPTYALDGISYWYGDDFNGEEEFDEKDFCAWIARNYDGIAEVTSIHADDCDSPGVWICYRPTTPTPAECADFIMDMLNGHCSGPKLVEELMNPRHHRTLQQAYTRVFCRAWIDANAAADDARFDGRNEATQRWAKAVKPASDSVPLPFI